MYIAFETLPGNDPRLDRDYKILDNWWHYTIAEVPDGKYLEWLNHVVLTKEEANASFFTGATNNEITIKKPPKGSKGKTDFIGYSLLEEEQGDKQIYYLTETDKKNCTSLMKKILCNYTEVHTTNIKEIGALKKLINSATAIDTLKKYLGEYFDTMSPGINVDELQPALTINTLKTQEED
jgi:hypothetical protein